ncbi:hypothetical protein NMG60_11025224 [Bertholletia excelsa]
MGTEVLRPRDCLIERVRVAPAAFYQHRRRNLYANGNGSRKPAARLEQKKRRSASLDDLRKNHCGNQQHAQVTILRRGQSLDFANIATGDRRGQRPARKGSADDMMMPNQYQIRAGARASPAAEASHGIVYAGSAFASSPEPSSLPLPSFFSKKQAPIFVDDSATRDLRRLLRLD